MAKTYRINEIFRSLQGEGAHTGTPAVFVRFSGCNLACPFCDTDFSFSREMTLDELVGSVREFIKDDGPRCVILTGGEPALQVDAELLQALHGITGVRIHIETNGTLPLPEGIDWITCSPKEGSRVVFSRADEVKVVYTGQDVERWRSAIRAGHYFLQPCSCSNTGEVTEYILAHPWWRLSLQIHKYIGIR